jgi:hypothetical protein
VPGGHHPRCPVHYRTEVILVPQFGLAGRDAHPHRQLQRPLRGNSGRLLPTSATRMRHIPPVTGVLEHKALVRLDRAAQHVVVCGKRRPH